MLPRLALQQGPEACILSEVAFPSAFHRCDRGKTDSGHVGGLSPSGNSFLSGKFNICHSVRHLVGKTMAGSKNQSLVRSCSSSITRLSKRLAPPPSMLRWSKLNVICASVLGTNSFFLSSHDGTFLPTPRPSSNV